MVKKEFKTLFSPKKDSLDPTLLKINKILIKLDESNSPKVDALRLLTLYLSEEKDTHNKLVVNQQRVIGITPCIKKSGTKSCLVTS